MTVKQFCHLHVTIVVLQRVVEHFSGLMFSAPCQLNLIMVMLNKILNSYSLLINALKRNIISQE